jgi:hypothetical protein
MGLRYQPDDVRDGYIVYCVGVPIGSWSCRTTFHDDERNAVGQDSPCE